MKKLKPSEVGRSVEIKMARGISARKTNELPFADRMAKRKVEDRELEYLRDELLAAMIRK
jgi:hypothetical protein